MNLEDVKIEATARKLFNINSVTTPEEFYKLLTAMEIVYQNRNSNLATNMIAPWTESEYLNMLGSYVVCEDFEIRKLAEFISVKSVYKDDMDIKAIKFADGDYTLLDDELKCHNGLQIYGVIDVFNTKYIKAKVSNEPKELSLTYIQPMIQEVSKWQ